MSLSRLLSQAQSQLAERLQALPSPYILFFSLSDGKTRARVIRAMGETFLKAWQEGARRCQNEAKRRQRLDVRWLRIDWPTDVQQTTWAGFKQRLAATKRNYFRFGIALDAEFRQFFLEGELNANAMFYPGGKKAQAGVNEKNFMVCARRHFGKKLVLDFADSELDATPVWLFAHDGLFVSNDAAIETLPGDAPLWVAGAGLVDRAWNDAAVLDSGRRDLGALEPDSVLPLIKSSADFLARQVKKDGQFVYGHFPNFGRLIPTYNTLRHASSIYSMLEAWELMQDNAPLLAAIRRALDYLDTQIIRRYPQSDGDTLAFNVDINDEIKLGANAVSLLALVKYDELTGDTRYRPLMAQMAAGICFLQRGEVDEQGQPTGQHPGKFLHVLNAEDLSLKEAFRIVYYDGEAAFGLMRLYGLTKDARWLETVERAFDYFLEMDHWRHHDHWLSYCANELTLYKPKEKYFRFGVQNIANHLDFILTRETTYPTLLELSMAFAAMLRRIQTDHPEMMHVLDGLDIDKFHRAMHHRAHYLLNGFFWPELAMYVAKPHTVVGSFFIRHHAFRVRIDDIEHYLSGYVAYWKLLKREPQWVTKSLSGTATTSSREIRPEVARVSHRDMDDSEQIKSPIETQFIPSTAQYYFCNLDFGEKLTGIERSALKRANLFVEYLGLVPQMLTFKLNLRALPLWQHYQKLGWVSSKVELINLYDDLMQISTGDALPPAGLIMDSTWVSTEVPDTDSLHQRVRDHQGKMRMYVVWRDAQTLRLDYINYFYQGRKIQRDKFNCFGQLAVSQQLGERGRVLREDIFTPRGRRCLSRLFEPGSGRIRLIQWFDSTGQQYCFGSEEALAGAWLISRFQKSGSTFIIDKHRVWAKPLHQLNQRVPQRLISAIHNIHIGEPYSDLQYGRLNSNYRTVLTGEVAVESCMVLTEAQEHDIQQRFPQAAYRVVRIPHAQIPPPREPDYSQRDKDLLVALVRLAPEKQIEDMLHIMAKLTQYLPHKKLHIYGNGPDKARLEALIDELGLQKQVFLMGYVERVEDVLERAAVSLLTSRIEGFAMSVAESLSYGCPVLAYDIRYGPASMIRHGHNGWLVTPRAIDEAVEILLSVFNESGRLQEVSANAYQEAQAYSPKAIAGLWQTFLQDTALTYQDEYTQDLQEAKG